MRRTAIAIATALTLAACSGGGGGASDGATGGGAATASDPTGPTAESTGETTGVSALDGTWTASDISKEDVLDALEAEGFGTRELRVFLDEMGVQDTMDLTWKVQAGQYTLDGVADGETDIGRIDYSGGSSTLGWSVEGDRLEFELIEDVQADYLGLPTDVWVAGLYTSAPWERVAS